MGVDTQSEVKQRVREGDQWYTGGHYDYSFGPARHIHAHREAFLRRCVDRARNRIDVRPLRVVEVGCGDGVNLYRLRDIEGCAFHGLDYNELRLERARELVPGAEFRFCNLNETETCPIEGGAHVLIFSHVIEHIHDDRTALARLRDWLAPGGVMAVLTPNEGCLMARLRVRYFDRWIAEQTDHVQFYTRSSLRRLVRESGLRVIGMRGEVFNFPSYRLHMGLLRRGWGYRLLRAANFILPGQTSGWQLALEVEVP